MEPPRELVAAREATAEAIFNLAMAKTRLEGIRSDRSASDEDISECARNYRSAQDELKRVVGKEMDAVVAWAEARQRQKAEEEASGVTRLPGI